MDNLKEQITECGERLIKAYDTYVEGRTDIIGLVKAVNSFPLEVIDVLKSNNYVQLQAGEDGLILNKTICEIVCKKPEHREKCKIYLAGGICPDVYPELLKAQKALDDKRIEQVNNTNTIEIFIDGKKTVFVREDKGDVNNE